MNLKNIFLSFFFFPIFSISQNVRHLSVNEGLPQSFVSDLIQDKEGFVWIATRNGLTRFDGHELKSLNHVPENENSIASNIISKLQKGENNTLWIFYETNEIDLVDLNTGNINHIFTKKDVQDYKIPIANRGCIIDNNRKLWHVFDSKTVLSYGMGDSNKNRKDKYVLVNDTICSIFYDIKGDLWVLSQKGLNKFNEKLNKFELIPSPYKMHFNVNFDNEKDIDNGVSNLNKRTNGELMWSDKDFLYFFKPSETQFRRVELPHGLKKSPKQIETGPDGNDYFVINNSVYRYDDLTGVKLLGDSITGSNTLHEREIETEALLIDQSGLIWIAANTDGIYQMDLNIDFETFSYEDFAINILKNEFNISLKDYFKFDIYRKGTLLPAYYLRSLNEDDKIWIVINRTVAYYDLEQAKLIKLQEIPLSGSEDFVPIKGITIDRYGNPLVIDENSILYSYHPESREWQVHSSSIILQNNINQPIKPTGLISEGDLIWITTEFDGLICINESQNKLIHLKKDASKKSLPTNNLINIISDGNNQDIFWIASYSGLLKFNKNTLETKLFSVKEGLPDNTIYTIQKDKVGYLWLGTNKGLCKFNTETNNQITYTLSHGLSNMEFNRYHQLILPNGSFALGGINEGVIFNPLRIKEDQFRPQIAVTSIKINNDQYSSENEAFFQYNKIKDLDLPYDKNNIAIEFAALQYSHPEDIRYRYRLIGYDDDWVISNKRREAVYTKIPYGKYTFEINATNTSGIWSDKIKTLSINISPAWWSTIWAFFLYVILSLLAVYFFITRSIRQKIIRKEIDLQRKEANHVSEINEIKTKFFTNMTHELRTPLSLIISPVEQLRKTKKKKDRKRLLKIIKRNANNLLNLSDQLLDIAKLEAGVLTPNYLQGDVMISVKKCIEAFKEEAKEKAIKIDLISPLSAKYMFSPYLLERIINNLVSNSIKYGVDGGRVEIHLLESKDGLTLKIEDNGIGISQKDLPNVFERFYQVEDLSNKSNSTGSGIGLSLVYELVKLQNGEIDIESRTGDNSGTVLTINLPYKKIAKLTKSKTDVDTLSLPLIENDKELPTILIVEDNKEMLDFLSISLKPNYRIILSDNAARGLKLAHEIIPEIIISDIMMANMDGLELCKSLKESMVTNHIPIILLTAKTELKSRLEGLTLGADDYMTKPFHVSELLLRIRNRIEIQEKQRKTIYEELRLLPSVNQEGIQNEKKDHFLIRIDEILDEHLDDEQFGVNDLALRLNMSRTSLHRKIKALTNTSTGKIIHIYRLKRASSFLKEGYNISEVSYKTGFGSPSYFTKCFKETYGLTPTEYIINKSVKQ